MTQKRQFTIIPTWEGMSLQEYRNMKRVFLKDHPSIQAGMTKEDKLWEYLFCLFYSLLVSGTLSCNAPIKRFYSLMLRNAEMEKGTIRVRKSAKKAGKSEGQRIYLSVQERLLLYAYLNNAWNEMPKEWRSGGSGELVPTSLFPEKEFRKRVEGWLNALCEKAGVDVKPSLDDIRRLAEVELLDIYPPMVVAAISLKVAFSPTHDDISSLKRVPLGATNKSLKVADLSPQGQIEKTLEHIEIDRIDECYRLLFQQTARLIKDTPHMVRRNIEANVDVILTELSKTKKSGSNPDEFNVVIAADWLKNELLTSKLAPNSIKNYFLQVVTVLRTELQGQYLDALDHSDIESILENSNAGSATVFKTAMRSLLKFARKHHNIRTVNISWKSIRVARDIKDIPILWPSDVHKILESTEDPQLRIPIILGYYCGMRVGEVATLKLYNIDLNGEPLIDISSSKSASGRRRLPLFLLLCQEKFSELSHFYCEKLSGSKDIGLKKNLITNADGLPYTNPQVLSMAVQRAFAKAGYPWATFHTLRHSFASMLLLRWQRTIQKQESQLEEFDVEKDKILLANGLADIARLLGHSDVKTTVMNYIHTIDLLQKAFLGISEKENPLRLSYPQGITLTGLSEPGFYKKFPATEGIDVEELIDWQIKRLKKIFDSGDGGIMRS